MRIILCIVFTLLCGPLAALELKIGITAPQGRDQALARWSALVDLLSEQLGKQVRMFPVSPMDGTRAFFDGHIDLLLGNPVQSAVVADTMRAHTIASMRKPTGEQFAGVIAVAQDSAIQSVSDLRGHRFAALGDWAAGGYLFQADYFILSGLPRPDLFAERIYADNQNQSVQMVLEGKVDAAFIRTGVLENLIERGIIEKNTLRVLDNKALKDDELARTTKWYPEWYLMAQGSMPAELQTEIARIVMGLHEDLPAVRAAKITGFQPPLEIAPVVQAMKRVGVAPYD